MWALSLFLRNNQKNYADFVLINKKIKVNWIIFSKNNKLTWFWLSSFTFVTWLLFTLFNTGCPTLFYGLILVNSQIFELVVSDLKPCLHFVPSLRSGVVSTVTCYCSESPPCPVQSSEVTSRLWLVPSDHVTWILASNWLFMLRFLRSCHASVPGSLLSQ